MISTRGAQQLPYRFNAEGRNVIGFRRKSAEGFRDLFRSKRGELIGGPPSKPFGKHRSGSDSSGTAAHAIRRFHNRVPGPPDRQPERIATNRILDLDGDGRDVQVSDISGVTEMVQQFGRMHRRIGMIRQNECTASRVVQCVRLSDQNPRTPRRPVIKVAAALIVRGGKILIGQRKKADSHGLKWEFPGGKIERGETPADALARELEEELGIQARIGREVVRYTWSYPRRATILLMFYIVTEYLGEPQSLAFERIQWELPERLPGYDFLEGDIDFVRRLASGEISLAA